MKDGRAEGIRWLRQAENDLEYARIGLREGFYAQVCFQCQQICEKALKAIHYGQLEKRVVFGHSLVQLASELPLEGGLREELAVLDQYYIPTRYPNGLPGGIPSEVFNEEDAKRAISIAENIAETVKERLHEK